MKSLSIALTALLSFALTAGAFERPAQVDIVVKRNKKSDTDKQIKTDKRGGEDSYRTSKTTKEHFQISATIKSKEFKRTFKEVTGEVYVLGKDVNDRHLFTVLAKKTENFDLNPGKVITIKTDTVSVTHKKDGKNESGQEYGGYVVVVRDAEGLVVKTKSSKSSALKKLKELAAANTGSKIRL